MADPSYNSRISHWIDVSKQLVPFNDDRKSLSIKAGEIRATNLSGKQWGQDISNFLKLAGDDNTYINLIQGGGLEINSNDLKYSKSKLDASNIDVSYLTANDVNFTKLKVQDLSASSVDISSSLRVTTGSKNYLTINSTQTNLCDNNILIGKDIDSGNYSFVSYTALSLKETSAPQRREQTFKVTWKLIGKNTKLSIKKFLKMNLLIILISLRDF